MEVTMSDKIYRVFKEEQGNVSTMYFKGLSPIDAMMKLVYYLNLSKNEYCVDDIKTTQHGYVLEDGESSYWVKSVDTIEL